MIVNAKDLKSVIDAALKSCGFVKRGSTWYRHYPETILVVDLQKDDFGGRYYINLAVALRVLNPGEHPPETRCHIRIRLERIVADVAHLEKVRTAFDLEDTTVRLEDRTEQIRGLIVMGAQFLERFTTMQLVESELRSDRRIRNRATVQLREFLKLDGGD